MPVNKTGGLVLKTGKCAGFIDRILFDLIMIPPAKLPYPPKRAFLSYFSIFICTYLDLASVGKK